MRITFRADGGFAHFPGLDRPLTVDTSELPDEEAARIDGLVRAAGFFERPSEAGAASPDVRDGRRYTIAIDDGPRSHTVVAADPVADESLHALIAHLQTAQRAALEP
jgi:hypothetical protein